TGPLPRLLRPGGIGPEALEALLGELVIDKAVTGEIARDAVVRAPGMKYKHYAPAAEVLIVDGSPEAAARFVRDRFRPGDAVLCFSEELPLFAGCNPTAYGREQDPESLSAGLFAALRALDNGSVQRIFARCPSGGGINVATRNRLRKSAGFHIVNAEKLTVDS
ncbi:MAG: translation factor SUA5, partial [Oscillospiraceae bacterium]|nr:translation factor SUA5 [Oscillospiraceae bacterium]